MTTCLFEDSSANPVRISVIAAFPEETKKACFTPKYFLTSDSSLFLYRPPEKIPATPCSRSPALIGAAVGGIVRRNFIRFFSPHNCPINEHCSPRRGCRRLGIWRCLFTRYTHLTRTFTIFLAPFVILDAAAQTVL